MDLKKRPSTGLGCASFADVLRQARIAAAFF